MSKRKLTPQQRQELRKEIKRKLSADRPQSKILKEVSGKYGIVLETARWYLNTVKKGAKKPVAKKASKGRRAVKNAKKPRKRRKGRTARKSRVPRSARNSNLSLADVSKNFTRRQLMRAAAASDLMLERDTLVGREGRLKDRQRELGRELRALTAARRKLESRIRRLAR